jgi:homocysteine S-methyltransferase
VSDDRASAAPAAAAPAPIAPIARREKSALARALDDHKFVVIAEVAAPRGLDLTAAVAQAQRFQSLGATAVDVPDYPKSGARASALALSRLIEQQGHVETLLHYTCRDRNLLGIQSDLVGAHTMGLRNVLLTTGQPAAQGTYADATHVFDVDAVGLTNMVVRLNHGLDIAGQSIGAPTRFHIGVAVNPFATNPAAEWHRLDFKVKAGAEFIVTPPILDIDSLDHVLGRLVGTDLPVIAGVVALESVRQAEFLASEVVGVRVPDAVMDRLRAAADPAAEGRAITREVIEALRSRVHGIQVTTLHGTPDSAERLLAALAADGGVAHV